MLRNALQRVSDRRVRHLRTNPDPCETNWHHSCPKAVDRGTDRTDIIIIIRGVEEDDNS